MSPPYDLRISPKVDKVLERLYRRNRTRFEAILKKADEIRENPHHYKNLNAPMQRFKRVHIDSSFVLLFSVDEEARTVTLEDFDHHDRVYRT